MDFNRLGFLKYFYCYDEVENKVFYNASILTQEVPAASFNDGQWHQTWTCHVQQVNRILERKTSWFPKQVMSEQNSVQLNILGKHRWDVFSWDVHLRFASTPITLVFHLPLTKFNILGKHSWHLIFVRNDHHKFSSTPITVVFHPLWPLRIIL